TGQQSGAISRSRSRNSGSPALAGLSTSMPASAANSATGLGLRRRPRPARPSGRVTTATTSCEDSRSALRDGSAISGVPAKTSRTSDRLPEGGVRRLLDDGHRVAEPLGLPDRLHRGLALLRVHPVDEDDAVEVVG